MLKIKIAIITIIVLFAFNTFCTDTPFKEFDDNNIIYHTLYDDEELHISATLKYIDFKHVQKMVYDFKQAKKCFEGFVEKRIKEDIVVGSEEKINILLVEYGHINGKHKIIDTVETKGQSIAAWSLCDNAGTLNNIYVVPDIYNKYTVKHETFHQMVCDTINWFPTQDEEERLARKFEGFKCKEVQDAE